MKRRKKFEKIMSPETRDKNKFHSITIPIPPFDVEDLSKINKTNTINEFFSD